METEDYYIIMRLRENPHDGFPPSCLAVSNTVQLLHTCFLRSFSFFRSSQTDRKTKEMKLFPRDSLILDLYSFQLHYVSVHLPHPHPSPSRHFVNPPLPTVPRCPYAVEDVKIKELTFLPLPHPFVFANSCTLSVQPSFPRISHTTCHGFILAPTRPFHPFDGREKSGKYARRTPGMICSMAKNTPPVIPPQRQKRRNVTVAESSPIVF